MAAGLAQRGDSHGPHAGLPRTQQRLDHGVADGVRMDEGGLGAQVLDDGVGVGRGGAGEANRREQSALGGDAVGEAARGPVLGGQQGFEVRERSGPHERREGVPGEGTALTACHVQNERGEGHQGLGGRGGEQRREECPGPFAYRSGPVRGADHDERHQLGQGGGPLQGLLPDAAVVVAQGEGGFARAPSGQDVVVGPSCGADVDVEAHPVSGVRPIECLMERNALCDAFQGRVFPAQHGPSLRRAVVGGHPVYTPLHAPR